MKIFFSIKTCSQLLPEELDLAKPHSQNRIIGREQASDWDSKIWMNSGASNNPKYPYLPLFDVEKIYIPEKTAPHQKS